MLILLAHQALLQAFALSACFVHCVPNEYEGMSISKKKKKKSRETSSPPFGRRNLNDEYKRWLNGDHDDDDDDDSDDDDNDDDDDADTDADAEDSIGDAVACHPRIAKDTHDIRVVGGKRRLDDILMNHIGPSSDSNTSTIFAATNGMNCYGEPQCKRRKIGIEVLDPPTPLSFIPPPASQGPSVMRQMTTTKMTRVSYCPISNMVVQESFVLVNSCWYPDVN